MLNLNQIFSRFTVYGQFAYFFVGITALLVIALDLFLLGILNSNLISREVRDVSTFLLILLLLLIPAYFIGHVIQSISTYKIAGCSSIYDYFFKNYEAKFNEYDRSVLRKAQTFFNVNNAACECDGKTFEEIYYLIYMFSLSKDKTGHVWDYHALCALYRGWLIIFSFNSLVVAFFICDSLFTEEYVKTSWIVISLILSIILSILFWDKLKTFHCISKNVTLEALIIQCRKNLT